MPTLYRGMNAAQLEIAYSPSSMIGGNYLPFVDRYSSESQSARDQFHYLPDNRYGDAAGQYFDLYMPQTVTPQTQPIHLFIHGGYWQELSAEDSAVMAGTLVEQGITLAVMNYTLAPKARIGQMVTECFLCLQTISRLNNGDVSLSASGHSAGAHLLMQMLHQYAAALKPYPLRLALAISGIYDLDPVCMTSINQPLGLEAETARQLSPMFQSTTIDCPVIIAVAEHDTAEFKRQSKDYGDSLGNARQIEIAGTNHFDIILELHNKAAVLRNAIVDSHE